MLITFKCNCPTCKNKITKYFKKLGDVPPFLTCGECGTGVLERQLGIPSTNSTEIIDNGLQAKKTEVSKSVIEKETKRLQEEE